MRGVFVISSLSVESAYSFKGSNITLDALFSHAKNHNHKFITLTDWTMHGAYKFITRAQNAGLVPVLGLKVVIEPHFTNQPLHAIFYVQNESGYKNLLKLASLQSIYNLITYDALKTHGEGLSLVLNTKQGELNEIYDDEKQLRMCLDTLKEKIDAVYIDCENEQNIPYVPIHYVMYLGQSDYDVYHLLANLMHEPPLDYKDIYALEHVTLKDSERIRAFIRKHSISFTLTTAPLPQYKTKEGITSQRYLRALSVKGLEKRLAASYQSLNAYKKRLEKELSTIHEMGFDDYFLIIWDLIKYARSQKILVGPGRGSAPGSLVAFALGITSIDPIKHDLLFERFLNKARKTMPDIDIDFPDDQRELVVKYLKTRYGSEHVALICTFGTFLSKSALRDSARVLKIDTKFIDEMAKKIAAYDSIELMIQNDADVKNRMETYSDTGKWLNIAQKIEGLPRHVSTHAAGVMVSQDPMFEYTALQEGLNTLYQTQYEQSDLEAMGLLKIDVLGLKNLSMIETVLNLLTKAGHERIDLYKLPLNDALTFKMLREKSTTGIFQLESQGMRRLINEMQIASFNDIAIALALYRPGPMESIPTFLKRRFKKEPIEKIDPSVDPILASTHGILLYQEQIMRIATDFAGYSLNEADILRRAVSKKDSVVLENERKQFVKKAKQNAHSEALGNKIYDYIVKFANYGFNKSHSVAYGMIAYWMAYLKTNYPEYFLSVLMKNALNNESQMKIYMQEIHDYGLKLKGPDIRKSGLDFVMNQSLLYFPILGIKTMGKRTIKTFLEIRSAKMFGSFEAFIKETRSVFTSRNYEYLIYSGALDCFGYTKRTMIDNLKGLINFMDYDQALPLDEFVINHFDEYDAKTLKAMEKDALGFNIVYDSLNPYMPLIQKNNYKMPADFIALPVNTTVEVVGILNKIKTITTKKGDPMAFFAIEDKTTIIDSVCFPSTYQYVTDELVQGNVYKFTGKVALKSDKRQLIISRVDKVNL